MQETKGGLMRRVAVACVVALVAGVTGATSQAGSRSSLASGAYPGSNGKIVFESTRDDREREIYVMNADGSGQAALTNNTAEDRWPAWAQ